MGRQMTRRDRVIQSLRHKAPDRVPTDFAAEPAVWDALMAHLGLRSREEVLRHLDTDCRVLSYDYGEFLNENPNALDSPYAGDSTVVVDLWGAMRRRVENRFTAYHDLFDYPLASAESISDLRSYRWPSPDWWDFTNASQVIARINGTEQYHIRFRIGSIFETAWSLRGLDRFFEDLVCEPEFAGYMLDRVTELHVENVCRVMESAGDDIDMLYCYDDIAHQYGLMISREMWRRTLGPRQKRLFELGKSLGKPMMYHCCGSIIPLIGDLIDIGLDVLNPIQTTAEGMDIGLLKREFGDRLSFHGGIDVQQLLPHGSPEEVTAAVEHAKAVLGENGGYICAPSHHVQADTPIENVLALYGKALTE